MYPLSEEKWITYITKEGTAGNKRKSPKKDRLTDIFRELVESLVCSVRTTFLSKFCLSMKKKPGAMTEKEAGDERVLVSKKGD